MYQVPTANGWPCWVRSTPSAWPRNTALPCNAALLPGLYSAFMGSFVYCLMGTSKDLAVGPTALLSLLTAHSFSELPKPEANFTNNCYDVQVRVAPACARAHTAFMPRRAHRVDSYPATYRA